MKYRFLNPTFCLNAFLMASIVLLAGCACSKNSAKEDPAKSSEFVADSWNGEFLVAISQAYETFVKTDEMPVYVNVQGIDYSQARYFSAACAIMDLIEKYPDSWQKQPDVDVPKYSAGSTLQWNTFEQDEISMYALKWATGKMRAYAEDKGIYPNYCCFGTRTWKDDRSGDSTVEYNYTAEGEQYVGNLLFTQALVAMSRVMDYYRHNSTLPEKVSVWWSDFLHSANNCPIDDATVVSAMQEAISGKTTDRGKAEAIFFYARDRWEWENYYNTKKGAVGTIKEKGGNCCDMAHAVVAMCRAAGIPARYIHGQCYFSSSVIGHVIPHIYVDGQWYICDPTNKNAGFGTPIWKGMETFNGLYSSLPF